MRTLEQLIAQLQIEAEQNPTFRNTLELLVALGEEILRPAREKETAPPSADNAPAEPSPHNSSQQQADSPPIPDEDIQRLIEHYHGGHAHEAALAQKLSSSLTLRNGLDEQEPPFDPELISTRTRLKAEVARWCADRLRGEIPADAESPYRRSAIARAKALPECYLWMLNYQGTPVMLDCIADCYDALAEVAELVPFIPKVHQRPAWADRLLELTATVQSALYHALDEAGQDPADYPDPDQTTIFGWLRWYTKTYQKFISRHMRRSDPADFTRIAEHITELDHLRNEILREAVAADISFHESTDAEPMPTPTPLVAKQRLRTLRYHVGHILRQSIEPEHHWRKIREQIEALIELGVPPSNVELRSALLPIIEDFPTSDEFLSQPVQLVLREIDRYLARQESATPDAFEEPPPTPEVQVVHTALHGKSILLIGGDERPRSRAAIETAFGLAKLEWVSTRPHQSLDEFLPYLKRPEIAAVLLAIRWSSHSYGEIAPICKEYGKPLVRLPGGYSPNQIAAQILAQAGTALGVDSSGGRT